MRLVVLDAAGTLLEVAGSVGEAYAQCARAAGAELDPPAIERGFAVAMREMSPLAFAPLRGAALEVAGRAWWRAVAHRAVEAAGAGPELDRDRFFDRAWLHFAEPGAWRVPADVRPALRALRAAGIPLAVLSNWDHRLGPLLEALGLAGFFARIVVSSELPAAKPSAEAFAAARRVFDSGAPAWSGAPLMVGDRVDHDVEPALAAGWDAMLIDRAGRGPEPPAGIPRLRSLTELGDRLAA